MTAPDQRAVPPPPPVADIWGAALADGSGRHVPVRRHWPELAAALDAEVDAAGMVPDTGQDDDPLRLRWEVQQLQEIVQDQHRAIAAVRALCADAMKLPTLEDARPADDRVSPRAVLAALDRAGSVPDPGQARARGELAAALAADPSLTWDELIYRAFQIRVGASGPRVPRDTVQAPDVAALLDQLDGRHCCDARMGHDDERCMSCQDEAWPCPTSEIVRRLRALLGTDTTPEADRG